MTFFTIPKDSLMCLGVIFAGIPVYFLGVKWKKPKAIQDKLSTKYKNFSIFFLVFLKIHNLSLVLDAITLFVQRMTYSIFDESKME